MEVDFLSIKLEKSQFERITQMLYSLSKIKMGPGKEELVKSRLMKRLRALNLSNFDDYIKYVKEDNTKNEIRHMIDVLTTNKTDFFREPKHFEYMVGTIIPEIANQRKIRIWSAGCSSGEEPYSIAIQLHEAIPNISNYDVQILATDISSQILAKAREAKYEQDRMTGIPKAILNKYFQCIQTENPRTYKVNDRILKMVKIARLNLMERWPMSGPFDIIFCRNVMIYFDKKTQEQLINRFWQLLGKGNHLFVGHSESMTGLSHQFRYVQPAIYQK